MGEGTNRVEEQTLDLNDLEQRVEQSRDRLDSIASELDRRRHVITNAKQTIARKPLWTAGLAAAGLAVVGAAVAFLIQRQRSNRTFRARAGRLFHQLVRVGRKPERLTQQDPDPMKKLLTAAGSTAVTAVVKRVMDQVLEPAIREAKAQRD